MVFHFHRHNLNVPVSRNNCLIRLNSLSGTAEAILFWQDLSQF